MAAGMNGKTAVVTGATSGMGRETALGLARLGADLALVACDEARGEATMREVEAAGAGRVFLFVADMASLGQVRRLASDLATRLERIDVLVLDAGPVHAAFLLTNLLLPRLKASAPARVVTVASGRSRRTSLLFAAELARRLAGSGVTSNSLHPGEGATGPGRGDPGWFRAAVMRLAPLLGPHRKGARTSLHLAASPEVEGVSGRHFRDSRPARHSRAALDRAAARRLWRSFARLTGLEAAPPRLASRPRTAILAP
jgi:NAD(P)-dependent dehydrogenase (short-subunit alcohol dehydrogenase family)